jgi:23S rRNA pseudouridine955/2504/2580 synthase
MKGLRNAPPAKDAAEARTVVADEDAADQRIDNFLLRHLKGVPRSHVYRVLRSGEVRVNSKRVEATYRVQPGDRVRIPPVRVAAPAAKPAPPRDPGVHVAYEDDALLVVDKPAGIAVHGGSGISFGVIERLRHARPDARFLELVHRIDRETSGLLMIAKKRSALTRLHAALREGEVHKGYLALVKGNWTRSARDVVLPLHKFVTAAGERRVSVEQGGQESRTRFERVERYDGFTLLRATLDTGRTHQIRVQLAHLGFPIAGDDKYGDFDLNRELGRRGLKRMFLHAAVLELAHPSTGVPLRLEAPLAPELRQFLDGLTERPAHAAAL